MNRFYRLLIVIGLCFFPYSVGAQQGAVCEGPGFHKDIEALRSIHNPEDAELIELSTSYQALGMANKALEYAELSLIHNSKSGSAMLAIIHARHLAGDADGALSLASSVYADGDDYQYSRGERSWLRHSILSMFLEAGNYEAAEKMVLAEFPDALSLADKEPVPLSLDFGLPLHTLEALIHAYRATERLELAQKLSRHLEGFTAEAFFEAPEADLAATQNWMLASVWAGILDDRVVPALTMAYEKGFRAGWRFNYRHHPVYWPYRNDPAFRSLMERIDADMAAQALCLTE